MSGLIFDEKTMLEGNIFKYEKKLNSRLNRYTENGMLLTTYLSLNELSTTVDRGLEEIEELFGKRSPLRYTLINDLPIMGFGAATPENTEENNVPDINVDGEAIIVPRTIIPKQYDCFIINHLKMKALFMVTSVSYDSMKVDGNYKITYHLQSTSDKVIEQAMSQVVDVEYTDLNAIGSEVNPIIKKDDFILRGKINKMVTTMIESYIALFYNERHNCFLYHDPQTNMRYFDMCGNEFMAKHGIMNVPNFMGSIVLNDKIYDPLLKVYYNNSVYAWLELDAPERLLQKFSYMMSYASDYANSSFALWEEDDIMVIQPLSLQQTGINIKDSFFDKKQLKSFMDKENEPENEYDKLIWKFIHKQDNLSIHDISLYLADGLISSVNHRDIFLYTPVIIYIIRKILSMN